MLLAVIYGGVTVDVATGLHELWEPVERESGYEERVGINNREKEQKRKRNDKLPKIKGV